MAPMASITIDPKAPLQKKPISYANLLLGASLNLFEVSTLGQPFEVIKTQLAANRGQSMAQALKTIYGRGGILGFYQGLIPWAWIEASTKGAVLLFTASEVEYRARVAGASPFLAGIAGGMGGGLAQAYTTMGFCTFMKTVEVTRHKSAVKESTFKIAGDIFKREGIRGINKGVNAVALRQCTNWASRFGITRFAQESIIKARYGEGPEAAKKATVLDKAGASIVGGALSCWNQPIEVIRVEMQSQVKTEGRPEKMTIFKAAQWIHQNNGIKGFYRGALPRIGLGVWQTLCMVALGDHFRALFKTN
ncbi:mitochondrial carrier domain-containing protein [Halteromyces radiatus]|uniref:mitochondrial carrier domain-containing protein n=1 Tax=Halteromyces radiatus TaxID=101107 RepID=UPI002220C3CD|nr:mitochondrial carrier domain-containing protein [Halteromyces radiatus]KAI8088874.1 mitochondrial carrier domain-containing protein [Halteromyces radiatus]